MLRLGNSSLKLILKSSSRVTSYIAIFGAVLLIIGLLITSVLPGGVQAQGSGGVGSGGGAGGGGGGHQAIYGYGWVKYNKNGPGPRDGFRDSTTWVQVQAACANTSSVYAFIVYDSASTGKIYNYPGWNNPANLLDQRFGVGASVDGGRATTMTIATAEAAFNQIDDPPYNVDTSDYGFRNNTMGWFCFDYSPTSQDECPNINGDQTTVPSGYYKASNGNCYIPVSCSPDRNPIMAGESVTFTARDGDGVFSWDNGASGSTSTRSYASAGTRSVNVTSADRTGSCSVVVNWPPPTCIKTSSQIIEVGSNHSFSASGGNGSYSWSAPGGTPASASPGSTFTTSYGTIGTRIITVSSDGRTVNCPAASWYTLPYIRVYANDVFAGGGLIGSTCNNTAGIYAYQNGTGRGSTTQLAAYALSSIEGFGSAQRKSPDIGLTFGNQAIPRGNFGSTQCIPDYYDGTKPDITTDPGSSINVSPLGTGAYQHTGDATITGGNINPNQRTALYIDGNVRITDNIRFPGSYGINNVPTFFVIVKGNIYIDPNVTRLDGILIAQQGTIYTCASHAPPFTASELFANCTSDKQLVVNGALIAQSIKFQRAFSSLRHSTSTETPIEPNHPCDIAGGVPTDALPVCGAEVINFDPLFYLSLPPFRTDNNRYYDAITSLAPVL